MWFSRGKAKADAGTSAVVREKGTMLVSIILIVAVTVSVSKVSTFDLNLQLFSNKIEHALGEYKGDSFSQAPFKEQDVPGRQVFLIYD